MTKNKKRIAFIAILFCIVMMCSACSATNTDKVNEQAIANEQAALNEQIVKICEDYELYVNNTPDKLIYTGATVGGVTTGGFHVQKGGISVSTGAGTGKWFVSHEYASTVNNKPWPDTVSYMVLSEQLFSEAQKNPYLKELIVPKEAREKWRGSRNDLADNQYLLNVVSMDKHTADCLKSWLAG